MDVKRGGLTVRVDSEEGRDEKGYTCITENYRSISSMEKFFFISCVYLHEEKESSLNNPLRKLDQHGERRTGVELMCTCVSSVPGFEGV